MTSKDLSNTFSHPRQPILHEFKPSEYMRARRPELFSDSITVEEEPLLGREVFEYHLDTLTSRKQEYEFEHFARRLAERELCPNLIPQTGPTGGGDSKTDAETYPVADAIALRWYQGIPREASNERWAFAFSTKKEWRPKVRADVGRIIQTDRKYIRIFFITNQFVKDKARADMEDELRRRHRTDVRILDRTWIMKCVFEHSLQRLAAETLGLTQVASSSRRCLGPHDLERENELADLEKRICDPVQYHGVEYQLAEDCMQSALLARSLGRPRHEVDGRFDRAERIAERVGHAQQRMRVAYMRTWTAYWWYDDTDELTRGYDRVEEFAIGSHQCADLEKLVNLWLLLNAAVWLSLLETDKAKLADRTLKLEAALRRLSTETERPNNALLAKVHLILMGLHEAFGSEEKTESIFRQLQEVIEADHDNPAFPFGFLLQIIQELDSLFPDNERLDPIFECVVRLTAERASKGTAGCLLLRRGCEKFQSSHRYEAIRLLGRAQENLTMEEYAEEFIRSLVVCAFAYESAGLLWAARRNMLVAASVTLTGFAKHGTIVSGCLDSLKRLTWLELQLGRIPHALCWIELQELIAGHLALQGQDLDRFRRDLAHQDVVLGLLLLKTDTASLKELDFMPQILDRMGLCSSWMALLFALGYEDYLRKEKVISDDRDGKAVMDFFTEWISQPAADDLPEKPCVRSADHVTLDTFILGCHLAVETLNEFDCVSLGETILAVLEAFLATGPDERMLPYQPELHIRIEPSEFVSGMPHYRLEETDGIPLIEIRHNPYLPHGTMAQRDDYHDWLREFMAFTLCQIAVVQSPAEVLEKMAREGAAFTRALSIIDVDTCIRNTLGHNAKLSLGAWKNEAGPTTFSLQRSASWNEGQALPCKELQAPPKEGEQEDGGDIGRLTGIDNLKHRDIRVHSVINIPLWDRAKWKAMAYIWTENEAPALAFGFEEPDAARAIFKSWRSRFGSVDKDEYIRISIVTGVDRTRPHRYAVVVGVNWEILKDCVSDSRGFLISRVHHMDPSSIENLQRFLDAYRRTEAYLVLPAHYVDLSLPPNLFTQLSLKKRKLHVCEAWQIGEHDPDIAALGPEMNPVIPDHIKDPPVQRAIESMAKLRDRSQKTR